MTSGPKNVQVLKMLPVGKIAPGASLVKAIYAHELFIRPSVILYRQ